MVAHLYRYRLNLKAPLSSIREGLLLELDGGWGDIAPLPGFSRETLVDCEEEIKRLWSHLQTAQSKLPSVQFALQCAKKPWPPKPFRLPLSALLWDGPVPEGYRTLKLKVGQLSIPEAIQRVKKIQAQGPYEIRLDANRSWTLAQALEFADAFLPTDFAYLEEPVRTFEELKEFSRLTQFPIAVDESLRDSPWQEIPSLKAAIIKPTLLGEVPYLPPHIDLILSGAYESGIGTLHIAGIPTQRAVGLDTYRFLQNDLLSDPPRIENGYLVWDGKSEVDRRIRTYNILNLIACSDEPP